MGSSINPSASPASPEFITRFKSRADADGILPFDQFMDLALYDEEVGYYRRSKARVGYAQGTDFYTASSSAPVFGELIACAAAKLLGPAACAETTFIEIGAETAGGILKGVDHGFRGTQTIQLGHAINIQGPCVVFSNELFDAQPFHRFVHRNDRWHEIGVQYHEGTFHEVELNLDAPPGFLPATAPDSYQFDAPTATVALLEQICRQPWHGLFIACDYGKSYEELIRHTPHGTARAYSRHTQTNDLLGQPGEQDLTCHVCWDWLIDCLSNHGFTKPALESQEAFLIHHAGQFLQEITTTEAGHLSRRKQSVMQLLHPGNLGQKFQVLYASRKTS